MKILSSNIDGIIFGKEHDSPLFIRKATFPSGYTEATDHFHPNSYEYYVVLSGEVTFVSSEQEQSVKTGDIVFFQENEPHRITQVTSQVEMLLLKKIGVTKVQL